MSEFEQIKSESKEGYLYNLFSRVSPETFRQFLLERKGKKSCLSCGMNKLYIPTRELEFGKGYYVWYQPINPAFDIVPDNAEYLTVCTHCGHISRYHAMIVFDWLTKCMEMEGKSE